VLIVVDPCLVSLPESVPYLIGQVDVEICRTEKEENYMGGFAYSTCPRWIWNLFDEDFVQG